MVAGPAACPHRSATPPPCPAKSLSAKGLDRMTRKRVAVLLLSGVLLGCGGPPSEGELKREPLTQRQQDSVVANSKLPGAGAVGGALNASDAAAARQQALDTIR